MRKKLYDGAVLQHVEDETIDLRIQLGFLARDAAHAREIPFKGTKIYHKKNSK